MVDTALPLIRRNGPGGVQVFVGELAPVGPGADRDGPEGVPAPVAVPRTGASGARAAAAGCRRFKRIDADGFAHHPYGPTERVPRRRDVINMLAIRTPAALPRPRAPRKALHPHARHLQHRVRPAEQPAGPAREHEPLAPGGADQREGGVRVPLLAPEEPLAVPAVRRSRPPRLAAREVVGLPDRAALCERHARSPPTTPTASRSS